ncbi:MAG: hypothetical protein JWO86_5736 [Myxococcaceae bacterium]|nr:hypothetical protein [Myxococcaceae bacterium]
MADTANTAIQRASASACPRARARVMVVGGIVCASLLAFAAVAACLPDLAAIAAADGSVEAAARFQGCGDGIIATLDDGGDAGESCDPGGADAAVGCTADCRIECDGGRIDPTTGHCYFAAGADTTFQAANARCQVAKAHVVTFVSQAEVDLASKLMTSGSSTYWVGLVFNGTFGAYGSNHPEEPGFPLPSAATGPCSGCFGVGDDAGVFPAEVDSGTTDCVAGTGSGWRAVPCSPADAGTAISRTTICEREPIGVRAQECIGGFCFTLASTAGKKRYLVAVSFTDPDTAALSCAGLGGSLVVFGSREEREQLAHEIRARYPDEADQQFWIGLVEDGGAWSWDDGVVADVDASYPLAWGNAQPITVAGARAYMRLATTVYDTQLAFADDGGKAARFYICQRPVQ